MAGENYIAANIARLRLDRQLTQRNSLEKRASRGWHSEISSEELSSHVPAPSPLLEKRYGFRFATS